jgi:hypothetical protein
VQLAQQLQAVESAIENAKKALIHDHIGHCLDESFGKASCAGRAVMREFKYVARYLWWDSFAKRTTPQISGRQLTNGGLIDLFDRRFSGDDTAKRHKPVAQAYAEVTEALGAPPDEMCLIAGHTWDTMGAPAARWEAVLIFRVNNDVLDAAVQPQYLGKDLTRRRLAGKTTKHEHASHRLW